LAKSCKRGVYQAQAISRIAIVWGTIPA